MKWSIPERVIEEGRKYVSEKRVLSINSFLEKKIWTAEVMGSEIYHVELDGTTKEEDFCECSYWKEHGYCRHTVAVELELKDRGISRVMTPENAEKVASKTQDPGQELMESFSRVFMQENRESFNSDQTVPSLQVEYKVEHKPLSSALIRSSQEVLVLSLRAGTDRLYIVKDLPDFLENFHGQGKAQLSGQSVDFKEVTLSDADREILEFLVKQVRSNQMINGSQRDQKSLLVNKRYLVLSPVLAEETIHLLQDSGNLQFTIGKSKHKRVEFIENELPFSFRLYRESGNSTTLSIDDSTEVYLKDYNWFLTDGAIYRPSSEQLRSFQPLQYFLQKHEGTEVAIQPQYMPDFTAYVLPLMRKLGEVTIEEGIKDTFVQEPLRTKVYFHYEKKEVHATVEFNYRHLVLSTNPEMNRLPEEGIQVIRDSQKEMYLLNRLKEMGYERNDSSYAKRMMRDEEFYRLFTQEIPLLEMDAEVYVDDLLDSMFMDQIDPETQIDVQNDGSFLDIRFDIKGITDDEIGNVLQSLVERKPFYKLENGRILSLETEEFQQVSEILQEIRAPKDFQNGTVSVPAYRGLELHQKLESEDKKHRFLSRKFQNLVQDLNFPEQLEIPVPKNLNADLRPYQVTGFKWLKMLSKYGFGGILADDMGLGKTVQVITYMLSEIEENQTNDPFLIVAPASLTYNWHHEIKKFAPSIESTVVSGTAEERLQLIESAKDNQVIITSYQSFRQDADVYKKRSFSTLTLDESQMVKNYHTKTAQALRGLTIKRRFALSGTPIENKVEELWAIFQLIMPGFFPNIKTFKTFSNEKISKMIRPFVLRRIKKDVLKELPDKIETNMYSSMTKEQKTLYLAYLQRIQDSIQGMTGADFRKNRIEILAGLTRLRQICCDPRLFVDNYEGSSGKLEQLKEVVLTARESGRRLLIFSQFTSMLAIIEKELSAEGVESFYLSGQTKPDERIKMVNRFNEGEKEVFLISLKAGGTGLNLTGADTVILYDLWWNPAVEEQAAGRAHRLGQKNVVQVWRLIAEGTIEEKINQLQQEKKALFDQVITAEGEDPKGLGQLTEEDIREILNIGIGT